MLEVTNLDYMVEDTLLPFASLSDGCFSVKPYFRPIPWPYSPPPFRKEDSHELSLSQVFQMDAFPVGQSEEEEILLPELQAGALRQSDAESQAGPEA